MKIKKIKKIIINSNYDIIEINDVNQQLLITYN